MDAELAKRIAAKISAKVKGESPDPDAAEDAAMSPGEMALEAIKENDPAALEEAIRRCYSDG